MKKVRSERDAMLRVIEEAANVEEDDLEKENEFLRLENQGMREILLNAKSYICSPFARSYTSPGKSAASGSSNASSSAKKASPSDTGRAGSRALKRQATMGTEETKEHLSNLRFETSSSSSHSTRAASSASPNMTKPHIPSYAPPPIKKATADSTIQSATASPPGTMKAPSKQLQRYDEVLNELQSIASSSSNKLEERDDEEQQMEGASSSFEHVEYAPSVENDENVILVEDNSSTTPSGADEIIASPDKAENTTSSEITIIAKKNKPVIEYDDDDDEEDITEGLPDNWRELVLARDTEGNNSALLDYASRLMMEGANKDDLVVEDVQENIRAAIQLMNVGEEKFSYTEDNNSNSRFTVGVEDENGTNRPGTSTQDVGNALEGLGEDGEVVSPVVSPDFMCEVSPLDFQPGVEVETMIISPGDHMDPGELPERIVLDEAMLEDIGPQQNNNESTSPGTNVKANLAVGYSSPRAPSSPAFSFSSASGAAGPPQHGSLPEK